MSVYTIAVDARLDRYVQESFCDSVDENIKPVDIYEYCIDEFGSETVLRFDTDGDASWSDWETEVAEKVLTGHGHSRRNVVEETREIDVSIDHHDTVMELLKSFRIPMPGQRRFMTALVISNKKTLVGVVADGRLADDGGDDE